MFSLLKIKNSLLLWFILDNCVPFKITWSFLTKICYSPFNPSSFSLNYQYKIFESCSFNIFWFRHREAAVKMPYYKNTCKNMWRWRRRVQRRGAGKVRTLQDYVAYFDTPAGQALLQYSPGRQLSYELVNDGEKDHLILFDKQHLKNLEESKEITSDSTFSARPMVQGVSQLMTISARMYAKVNFCHL